MKLSVKHFASMSLMDSMKKYKDVCEWVSGLKTAKEIEIDCSGNIVNLSIDPKSKSIKASDKSGKSKTYKIKWDAQQIYFTLVMLSIEFQKDETMTPDEHSSFFLDKLTEVKNEA